MDQHCRQRQRKPQQRYVSVFRIDGAPILPPVMTSEKRRQMLKFKEKAIALENQFQQRKYIAEQVVDQLTSEDEEDTYLMHSNMMRQRSCMPPSTPSTRDQAILRRQFSEAVIISPKSNVKERLVKLCKSETLIYDNNSNSVIMPMDDSQTRTESAGESKENQNNSIRAKPRPYAAFIEIPSICVNPPTPLIPTKTLCESLDDEVVLEKTLTEDRPPLKNISSKHPQRSATSPSLKPTDSIVISSLTSTSSSDSQLIRSNSFTLEAPSSALLEHIRNQRLVSERRSPSTATKDTIESKAKRVQKVELKARPSPMRTEAKPSSPFGTSVNNNIVLFKNKRSPYELKATTKARFLRKHKTASAAVVSAAAASKQQKQTGKQTYNSSLKQIELNDIEEKHRQKLCQLMRSQQEEQKRLQLAFEAQKKNLLEQLTVKVSKAKATTASSPRPASSTTASPSPSPTASSPAVSLSISATNSESFLPKSPLNLITQSLPPACASAESSTAVESSRCTPRRRLVFRELSSPTSTAIPTTAGADSSVELRLHQQQQQNHRKAAAATVINAYARGFLTRRLMQTEQVQRIIQTIRDTLMFALSLHMDSNRQADEPVENIKLKARLLQQLSSASGMLHLVFFQTTMRERMEIIARDRKRMRNKLLNLKNRSPRIAT